MEQRANVSADGDRIKGPMPNWMQEALQVKFCFLFPKNRDLIPQQENNAYTLTESRIPALSLSSLNPVDVPERTKGHNCHAHWLDHRNESRRFRKEDLQNAKIINQVDRKFVACTIDGDPDDPDYSTGGRSLVLIDQHAADERVRVERFLKDLCLGFLRTDRRQNESGVKTKELSPPVAVLLTRHEALRVKNSEYIQAAFCSWGFQFTDLTTIAGSHFGDADSESSSDYVQVLVGSIPEVVSDKVSHSQT